MIKIDVKSIANKIRSEIKEEVSSLGVMPKLVTIMVGDDPASMKYVKNKSKLCEDLGIRNEVYFIDGEINQEALNTYMELLNEEEGVNGILLQLPLPKHLDSRQVIERISPEKDVDGLTVANQGRLFNDMDCIAPCTPLGIMKILEHLGEDVAGKQVCVIGRSNLLGKPLAAMLTNANATVTLCHSHTDYLPEHTLHADIVISCTGKHGIITPQRVSSNALVIDAGTSFIDGKLVGDFNTELFIDGDRKGLRYTPVPNGVGQMTTTMLCWNTLQCYKLQHKKN